MWTREERKFLLSLNTPDKIQKYLDTLVYNTADDATSPRYVMMTGDAHCLEGGMLAACALELRGHKPLMVSMQAVDDDDHVIVVYKEKHGWGAISKSSTTLLRAREPRYKTIRELVMSYFDFYFTTSGKKSLYGFSAPINLNHYNHWNWRTSDENLVGLGQSFNDVVHYEILSLSDLKKLPTVHPDLVKACFLT